MESNDGIMTAAVIESKQIELRTACLCPCWRTKLRSVELITLAGIESVMAPRAKRELAWARLARDLDKAKLDAMTVTRPLADAPQIASDLMAGKVRGRVVLEVA